MIEESYTILEIYAPSFKFNNLEGIQENLTKLFLVNDSKKENNVIQVDDSTLDVYGPSIQKETNNDIVWMTSYFNEGYRRYGSVSSFKITTFKNKDDAEKFYLI